MKSETKVILFLIAGCLLAEGVSRWLESGLSKDVAHLQGLRDLPRMLEPRGRSNVLILGNSLARCGIDGGRMNGKWMLPSGRAAEVAGLHPDASGIVDWGQGFRRYVVEAGGQPEVVLLCTGRAHLSDTTDLQLERLAAWLVPPDERLAFIRDEGLGLEKAVPFWLASQSRLFANRGRVQPLLFYKWVAGFEETTRLINHERGEAMVARREVPEAGGGATRHLGRLIADVAKTGARLVVVVMPLPEAYELPREVLQTLHSNRVPVIDFGNGAGFAAERFPDGYHLDEEGAGLLTGALVERLAEVVR